MRRESGPLGNMDRSVINHVILLSIFINYYYYYFLHRYALGRAGPSTTII